LLVCASSSRTHGQQCHNRDLRIFNLWTAWGSDASRFYRTIWLP
jgi:hypothetical protein